MFNKKTKRKISFLISIIFFVVIFSIYGVEVQALNSNPIVGKNKAGQCVDASGAPVDVNNNKIVGSDGIGRPVDSMCCIVTYTKTPLPQQKIVPNGPGVIVGSDGNGRPVDKDGNLVDFTGHMTEVEKFTSPVAPTSSRLTSYTPLEPGAFTSIMGGSNKEIQLSSIGTFLGQLFNYLIAIAGVLALVMIIWGGIEYMTTESFMGKGNAKKRIWDALLGLGIALVSWLILYTINPCLVQFNGGGDCKNSNTFISRTK
jgi:hypothetical protein